MYCKPSHYYRAMFYTLLCYKINTIMKISPFSHLPIQRLVSQNVNFRRNDARSPSTCLSLPSCITYICDVHMVIDIHEETTCWRPFNARTYVSKTFIFEQIVKRRFEAMQCELFRLLQTPQDPTNRLQFKKTAFFHFPLDVVSFYAF